MSDFITKTKKITKKKKKNNNKDRQKERIKKSLTSHHTGVREVKA